MTTQKLSDLAQTMRLKLCTQNSGALHHPLPRGLHIVLQRTNHQWRLGLGREGVYPSDIEVSICQSAFGVPEGASEERVDAWHTHAKTRRSIHYFVINLRWREEQAELMETR